MGISRRWGLLGVAGLLWPGGAACADIVMDWNSYWLQTIRESLVGPGPNTRIGAILHVAIYDAVNSVEGKHQPYHVKLSAPAGASAPAAAAAAAHRAMSLIFPERQWQLDRLLAESLKEIPDGPAKVAGIAVGVAVAEQIVALREHDGWELPLEYTPGPNPGDWRETWPDFAYANNPLWGDVTPWALRSGDQFRPSAGPLGFTRMPALLASEEYAAHFNEVKELGALESRARTPEQTLIAWFWSNDAVGTYRPMGHLNEITQVIARDRGNTLAENARLFALLNIALADAAVAAWDCKYKTEIDFWRPITGVREADTDGNRLTEKDEDWEPLAPFTPPFPAFVSGHATFGAAHAAVLRAFYGTDEITFTVTSDDAPGVWRTFHSLSEAALENGRSRVYLGVHWQFDADEAYPMGTGLGAYVAENFLRESCPADCDGDGALGVEDFLCFQLAFALGEAAADCDGSGGLNIEDFVCFQLAYALGC